MHAFSMEALCVATHVVTKQESAEVIVGAGRRHRDLVTGNEPGEEKSREDSSRRRTEHEEGKVP